MPSLKDLQRRIASVKSTRKITSAMKVVAAAKLRRAQLNAAAARPYAEAMENMLQRLTAGVAGLPGLPPLMAGNGNDKVHLLVSITSDRGLAGGFNINVGRTTRNLIAKLQAEGKAVKLLPVGKKGIEHLKYEHPDLIIDTRMGSGGKDVDFASARALAQDIIKLYEAGEFDVCTLVYNRFKNVMTQIPTKLQLIPLSFPESDNSASDKKKNEGAASTGALYEFEPNEEEILMKLLPKNLEIQIYKAMLESAAGEQGARMSAMDGATRNAGKSIDRLSQQFNTTRQANITNQLIEIISGANTV